MLASDQSAMPIYEERGRGRRPVASGVSSILTNVICIHLQLVAVGASKSQRKTWRPPPPALRRKRSQRNQTGHLLM